MTKIKKHADPQPVDLVAVAFLGDLYVKLCKFDHFNVDVRAYALFHERGGVTYKTCFTLYDGVVSKSHPERRLNLSDGYLCDSAEAELCRLARRGYVRFEIPEEPAPPPEPEAPKRRRGRPRKSG